MVATHTYNAANELTRLHDGEGWTYFAHDANGTTAWERSDQTGREGEARVPTGPVGQAGCDAEGAHNTTMEQTAAHTRYYVGAGLAAPS
ncbi:MAG: hypothetical protein R6V05_02430 [Candidatus Brocadiia bacterium]